MKFEDMYMDLPSPYLKEVCRGEQKIHGPTYNEEYTPQQKKTIFYEHRRGL
jgi:hypothetical protein